MAYRHNMSRNDSSWEEDNMHEMDNFEGPPFPGDFRNQRYREAFGDYRGGYNSQGPPLGFGPLPGPMPLFGPRPPPPPFVMGRGFGPRGPPPPRRFSIEDRAIKYLMRCGILKETLKNLPREMLKLIEPNFCGLCGINLESFPTSRLHYISKNHMKAQKRWMTQKSEMGGLPRKETPLKARDLYCELCDVHITSKPHADSHYAGKLHRAIVEGRKNPKNVMLLQKNMEDRLQQLIRREKKHIKIGQDAEKTQEKTEDKIEKKNIPPELYCEICKTFMTNTEQMTMHLNGKKHLNKEKQHILKMMKGEVPDPEPNTENTGEENNAVTGEDDGNEETQGEGDGEGDAEAEDNFDWGNGSTSWDEPANE